MRKNRMAFHASRVVFFGKLALYRLVQGWRRSPENTSPTRSAGTWATCGSSGYVKGPRKGEGRRGRAQLNILHASWCPMEHECLDGSIESNV